LHSDKDHQILVVGHPKICSTNPKWRTAAILKNVKCDISAAVRPILMKFDMIMHLSSLNLMGNCKFQNFKIQDGGRRPPRKSKNRGIFKTVQSILANDHHFDSC